MTLDGTGISNRLEAQLFSGFTVVLHDTYYVVAHFHYVLRIGAVSPQLPGIKNRMPFYLAIDLLSSSIGDLSGTRQVAKKLLFWLLVMEDIHDTCHIHVSSRKFNETHES